MVNVTLFSHVTLIRKLQSTSDIDHFHARDLPCSCVKSRDDPISGCRVDSAVPYSFIYVDGKLWLLTVFLDVMRYSVVVFQLIH